MQELERTYLIKKIPEGLTKLPHKEILDIYIPSSAEHPVLRIRKAGNKYEITKKEPIRGGDSSDQLETTIPLTQEEYAELAELKGKRVRKVRYYLTKESHTFEIDVFQDGLRGLVLVDVEFKNIAEKNAFAMPDFCLAEVTQEDWCAGGMLCGKQYKDIEPELKRFGYLPIVI